MDKSTLSLTSLPPVDSNILFAQNMVCMSMMQAQQWEKYEAKLREHTTKKRTTCTYSRFVLNGDRITTESSKDETAPERPQAEQRAMQQAEAVAMLAAVQIAAHVANVARRQPERPAVVPPPVVRENVWARDRLGVILKLTLLLVLFDVSLSGLLIYLLLVVFYLYGIFDEALRYFSTNRHPALDEQLVNLRDTEYRRREERASAASAAEARASGIAAESGDATANDAEPVAVAANVENAREEAVEVPPNRLWRIFYQSVVMFFLTLVPWWTPDPTYLL